MRIGHDAVDRSLSLGEACQRTRPDLDNELLVFLPQQAARLVCTALEHAADVGLQLHNGIFVVTEVLRPC